MSAIQLTRGFKYVPCEVVRSHAQRTLVTRLLCPLRHPQLSNIHVTFARRAYSRQPVYALAAADGADPLASTQTPSSNPAAQGLSDEEQKNSRNALHATPDPAVSGVDSRAMPEGDEDVEMLNAVSGSQPEAQLVTDKPTELPEGVKVEAVLRDVAPQESTPASAQSVEQPLASITLSTPIQDAIPVPLATQDLASPDTPTAANVVSPGATTAATNSSNISPIKQDWDTILQQFLDMLQLKGHYRSRVLVNSFSIAVLKKGILDFARSRQDILFSLPEEKVRAVLAAGVPYDERKLTQATKRLSTNFGEAKGYDIGPEGSFQDLTRFLIAAAYSHAMHKGRVQTTKPTDQVDWDSHRFNPGHLGKELPLQLQTLVSAVADLLPDIITAAQEPPAPEAQAKAEATRMVREQKAVTIAPPQHNTRLRPSNARGEPRAEDRRQDRSRFFMEKGWDGFEAAPAGGDSRNDNMRPGDWSCPDCNQHNFARNTECYKCGAHKTDAASPRGDARQGRSFERRQPSSLEEGDAQVGDWNCSECGTSNFARRSRCFKCGIPRAKAELGLGQKPGDWSCPSCSANNFSRRTECFRCQTPKPADDSYRSRGRADSFSSPSRGFDSAPRFDRAPRNADSAPFQYEAKPGDWACDSCGASNFAKRGVCFKCGNPKSGGSSTMSTSGRATGRVFDDKKSESSWFDGSSDASDGFGPSDDFGPSSSSSNQSSSTGWDPRTSLGAAQPQTGTDSRRSSPASRGGFDRAQPDFGRSSSSTGRFDRGSSSRGDMTDRRSSGSSWERGESRPSRGGSQSRGRQGGFADRGRGSSTRGSSTRGRNFGNTGRSSGSTGDLPGGSSTEKPWESRPAPQNREDNFDF